jgi:hypothetical protein
MASSKALARLAAIVIIGLAGAAVVYAVRSPLAISESEAREIVRTRELIGLPLEDAGKRLQHRVPQTKDGVVVLDFKQVKAWRAGPLTLDVRDGRVTAATWGEPQGQ